MIVKMLTFNNDLKKRLGRKQIKRSKQKIVINKDKIKPENGGHKIVYPGFPSGMSTTEHKQLIKIF